MTRPSLLTAWRAALDRIERRRQLRQDEYDLRSLPDHVLRDLGIGRSEIMGVIQSGRGTLSPSLRTAA